jgi:hypothetical protein
VQSPDLAWDGGGTAAGMDGWAEGRVERAAGANLPALLSGFVGPQRELAELDEVVLQRRLMSVAGPGGIGNTRLAIEAASS